MIHQYKVELEEKILKKIKRKRITNFSREDVRENNKKFIENNTSRKISKNGKNIVINTKLS